MHQDEERFEIAGYGVFQVEQDLVVGVEPVLFVCRDGSGQRYLFMAYDTTACDYVFCKIHDRVLIEMLQDRISLVETFRNWGAIGETYLVGEEILANLYAASSFPQEKLPRLGAFFELRSPELDAYRATLEKDIEYCTYSISIDYSGVITTLRGSARVEYHEDIADVTEKERIDNPRNQAFIALYHAA